MLTKILIMSKEYVLEFVSIIITGAAFVWELQKATEEQKFIMWILLATILLLTTTYVVVRYLKDKMFQIEWNSNQIRELKKSFHMQRKFEEMNTRITILEHKNDRTH